MTQSVKAVYANGVLRPLEPVNLPENEQVTLTITNDAQPPFTENEDWLDREFMAYIEKEADDSITLEAVRDALSTIPGALSDDVRAERDEN
jgi:predicted DNA-binding antitoxin AbrB/MazE fold protein